LPKGQTTPFKRGASSRNSHARTREPFPGSDQQGRLPPSGCIETRAERTRRWGVRLCFTEVVKTVKFLLSNHDRTRIFGE